MAQWQMMGWVNVVLVVLMGAIYPLKQKMKSNKKLIPIYRVVRVAHPVVGVVMILIGLLHGAMVLGQLRLHSGSLVLMTLILMALVALAGNKLAVFRKTWRPIHRILGLLLVVLLLAHLLFPWWL
ncbi:hypothetical protein [Anoxynatronum buryatiense]|uniref:Uncharacterized protein n=1 Tax=Anoxynatronum buryatiense TaxID=489973 RepID=A0AA45WT32_9CLOT|nr:hypothetical protein [Anoxynatronum buryatiense]SMP40457.1 hypothetical protein SAMN06296020_101387 [Anoxynatronum buryatiense]